MNSVRWRPIFATAAVLATTLSCSKSNQPAVPTPESASSSASSAGEVIGKLAEPMAGAIVVLEPATPRSVPATTRPAIMDQSGQQFLPGLLLAQAGQTVKFRNSEDVLHNVRVTEVATENPVLNVATIPFGSYDHKFERPGFYTVSCDIHPTMRSHIFVTASPYTTTTEANGSFAVKEVQPGAYKLTLYAGGDPVVRSIEVKPGPNDVGIIQ
jgi:plastocyanin